MAGTDSEISDRSPNDIPPLLNPVDDDRFSRNFRKTVPFQYIQTIRSLFPMRCGIRKR